MGYLTFEKQPIEFNRKTEIYFVKNKNDGTDLGIISFYPQWRGYVFKPLTNTLFDTKCLIEISTFLTVITTIWRKGVRSKKY